MSSLEIIIGTEERDAAVRILEGLKEAKSYGRADASWYGFVDIQDVKVVAEALVR